MTNLSTLPGISPGLAAELRAAGIRDVETLRAVGVEEAAQRVAEVVMRDPAATAVTLAGALGETRTAPPVQVLGVVHVEFAVGDLERALTHYAGAMGLPVADRRTGPPVALLGLGPEAPGLLLREDPAVALAPPTARAPRLRLEVPDALAAAAQLRESGVDVREAEAAAGRVVEVADPWGNVVGLSDTSAPPAAV